MPPDVKMRKTVDEIPASPMRVTEAENAFPLVKVVAARVQLDHSKWDWFCFEARYRLTGPWEQDVPRRP
jgi:hypothetical protein